MSSFIQKFIEVYLTATPATPKSGPKAAWYKLLSLIAMPAVTALVFLNIIGYNGGLNKDNASMMLIIFYSLSFVIHVIFDFWRFNRLHEKFFSENS